MSIETALGELERAVTRTGFDDLPNEAHLFEAQLARLALLLRQLTSRGSEAQQLRFYDLRPVFPLQQLPDALTISILSMLPSRKLVETTEMCRHLHGLAERAVIARAQRLEQPLPMCRPGESAFAALRFSEAAASTRACTITAGHSHNLSIRNGGKNASTQVLAWGGDGDEGEFLAHLGQGQLPGEAVHTPTPVRGLPAGICVREVSAGFNFSLLLSSVGVVWSWGSAEDGRLGHGDERLHVYTPKLIEALAGMRAVKVAAGSHHAMAATEFGQVFSWGRGAECQLGLGRLQRHGAAPQLLEALSSKRIYGLAGGLCHSLAVSETGEMYSWGDGSGGKLGHGNSAAQYLPKRIETLAHLPIQQVSAGHRHSLAVTRDGRLFSWGHGELGAYGCGQQDRHAATPVRVESLGMIRVQQACAAPKFTLVLSDQGDVFVLGADLDCLRSCTLDAIDTERQPQAVRLHAMRFSEIAVGGTGTWLARSRIGELYALGEWDAHEPPEAPLVTLAHSTQAIDLFPLDEAGVPHAAR
mmetsp:Transcript_27307/g.45530  ORF Transcript_27307/g.45530 Transcript_27307/m.45530 type:complete len:528 (+) Transcript_27307:153-1736(+)